MAKVKVATTWLQGCSGCHISFLDMHEDLLGILNKIDIVYSPIVDVKTVPRANIGLVEGAVANQANIEHLIEFRKKCDFLITLGSCACFGGIGGLRNLFFLKDVLERGYIETESTVSGKIPKSDSIPKLLENVQPVDRIVKVDWHIPGCPPLPYMIKDALSALLAGKKPKEYTRNLCHECEREHKDMLVSKREFVTDDVYAPIELKKIDPDKCFIEQGILCMGPATREGCHTRCLKGNMPCRGCMGPTPDALEQGSKIIDALASILPAGGLMYLEDIVGTGYRYSVPISIFPYLSGKEKKK